MKILQVVPHYLPATSFGGPQVVAHALSKSFMAMGHDVLTCTTNLETRKKLLDVPTNTKVVEDGVDVIYHPTRYSRYWGYSPTLRSTLRSEIPKVDLTLVHFHYQFASYIGSKVARTTEKPYVVFLHGSLHKRALEGRNRLLKKTYLRMLEGRNFSSANLLIHCSHEEQNNSQSYGEHRRVIPNGLDLEDFQSMPVAGHFRSKHGFGDQPILLFLGRLSIRQKGLDLLLEAFSRAARSNRDLQLVLAGAEEAGSVTRIKETIRDLRISHCVSLPGLLEGPEKLAALRDADVFVLPSRSDGMSISLLEALYVGLPVLITDQVGLSNIVSSLGAGVVATPNVESITEGINHLADWTVRGEMRGRATDYILREHTWDAIARDFLLEVEKLGKVRDN